jgi:Mg/Co/Ni transporter MgtE
MEDSSVLQELKETIRRQAAEIETLKKQQAHDPSSQSQGTSVAATANAKLTAATAGTGGHHGPPVLLDELDYLQTSCWMLGRKRVGWLSVFLCSLSLTALIVNQFEETLSRQIELAYFVPLLAGHGGNTGGQTVGTVLAAFGSGTISQKDAPRVICKEACTGAMVGSLLGTCVGLVCYFLMGISTEVSWVVACTIPLVSFIAATFASALPFLCLVFDLDPTVIAAPAMTSLVDVSGLLSYFLIANAIFRLFKIEL